MQSKVCITCKKELPLGDFNRHNRYEDGLQQKCRLCFKAYYRENKQRILETQKVWVESNREKTTDYKKSWKSRNPQAVKKYNNDYRLANKPMYAKFASDRNARKVNATPKWLTSEQNKQISDFYALAKDCSVVSGETYQVDHIVPIRGKTVCGLHVPWNLQVLPRYLNEKKSNRFDGWQERTPTSR